MADLLAVLFTGVLKYNPDEPSWIHRDRLILSKGHSTAALYAVLAETKFFSIDELQLYGTNGSRFIAHASHKVPGVEFSTGSLGHGLPFACGKALAAKRTNASWGTYVLLSDGELDEGSNWEAILFAGHHRLGQLTAIVDYNKLQSFGAVKDILNLDPLREKLESFRWEVIEVDGHDIPQIQRALSEKRAPDSMPLAVVAHTIKGKGVDFMENKLKYHYAGPRTSEQLCEVLSQLKAKE